MVFIAPIELKFGLIHVNEIDQTKVGPTGDESRSVGSVPSFSIAY